MAFLMAASATLDIKEDGWLGGCPANGAGG